MIDPANLLRLVHFFDVLAAVVFAVSGALVASRKGLDVMGFMWLAVVTGVGGGTVRDLLIGAPVFWVHENGTLLICFAAALAVWASPGTLWKGPALASMRSASPPTPPTAPPRASPSAWRPCQRWRWAC